MSPLCLSAGRMAQIKIYGVNGVKDPKGLISEYAETRDNYSFAIILHRRTSETSSASYSGHKLRCGWKEGCSKSLFSSTRQREVGATSEDRGNEA